MKRDIQGHYVVISTVGEEARAFVPAPLPPKPPIDWTPELRSKFDQALLAHVQAGRVAMDDALKAATHPHDFKLLVSSEGQRHTSVESVFADEEEAEVEPAVRAVPETPAA
jgi:hypothetical protein